MHYLYLTAVKKTEDIEKENLIAEVNNILENNNFAGEGGYWGCSKADWFVMGGRWSGYLQEVKLDGFSDKARAMLKENEGKDEVFLSTDTIKKYSKELQAIWESLGGKGVNVWNREGREDFEDNCMLLDTELYNALNKKISEDVEIAIIEEGCVEDETTVKEFLKDKSVIDNYYLVVVDYHN